MRSINLHSVTQANTGGLATNVSFFILILTILLLPLIAQSDDLFDSLMKLAKEGNAEAQFKVGEMYETGIGAKQDKREAIYWTTRSANQGNETAGFKLLYWDVEKKGLQASNKVNVEELNNKAKQGNAQAQYYLGKMYAYGVGINKNPEVAINWLYKASLAGVLEAELELTSVREELQREAQKKKRFESDICSGKVARFTSTCR